ncbi:hypothetical protein ERO13_A11G139200v2 [Gossypium hirsutum]|uniref:Uncharacterized protein isoform X2 n=1 Tax=Gossypium hirsutum TaxID=3635 RepID=A0A1U8K6M7_GOSHI|nr:uncharacterized protein LOC107912558 isoform X2 [Gossypium hirsutum]KAG4174730.1 hypothetical protein ERO13_A11G139200v2 [Gossypium hirsutum]
MSIDNKEKPKTIQLFCPSVSKLIWFVAWDSQKLDIGSISRMFGLDPSTVKLNGHFISRGVDLVSSSVTWRSLLSFFSSKGLSTGTDDHKGALIVDGKLCKVGSKRAHEPQDGISWSRDSAGKPGINDVGLTAKLQLKDIYSFENKKLRESSLTGSHDGGDRSVSEINVGVGLKRQCSIDHASLLKKLKINDTNSDIKGNSKASNVPSTPFKCSYLSGTMKRRREDEVIVGVPCKRISPG